MPHIVEAAGAAARVSHWQELAEATGQDYTGNIALEQARATTSLVVARDAVDNRMPTARKPVGRPGSTRALPVGSSRSLSAEKSRGRQTAT